MHQRMFHVFSQSRMQCSGIAMQFQPLEAGNQVAVFSHLLAQRFLNVECRRALNEIQWPKHEFFVSLIKMKYYKMCGLYSQFTHQLKMLV